MYSISEVAKITSLTARALRHYEEIGLISVTHRGSNGYRYFSEADVSRIEEIKKYKEMDFSLDEIKSFLAFENPHLEKLLRLRLERKLVDLNSEIQRLQKSKAEIQAQLLATKHFFNGTILAKDQRRALMEAIQKEIIEKLKSRKNVDYKDLEYLKRESILFDTEEKRSFFKAVESCLEFAKKEGIHLGSVRGSAPASLSLYAIGWTQTDPSINNLVPERILATNLELHIDVEFRNGQKFIDYCRSLTHKLKIGRIEAFKLPILDIIENTHSAIGSPPKYDEINENDPLILDLFRAGDIEKVFSFDIPKETLLAKHFDSNYYRNGLATQMKSDYLRGQKIFSFTDVINIEAIHRPEQLDSLPFMQEYIDRYPRAKVHGFYYDCLSPALNEALKPNFGVIIYQEDLIQIIREYTSWDYAKCNQFRRALSLQNLTDEQRDELLEHISEDVLKLLIQEAPVAFCKAHSVGAWSQLIKKTAVLKALHKDIYFAEIEKWESEHGYSWGDFGFISDGISILQQ